MVKEVATNGTKALGWFLNNPAIGRWSVVFSVVFSAGMLWEQQNHMKEDVAELQVQVTELTLEIQRMRVDLRTHETWGEVHLEETLRRLEALEKGG